MAGPDQRRTPGPHQPPARHTAIVAAALLGSMTLGAWAVDASSHRGPGPSDRVRHIVVVYLENHSFDNLWGGWPGVDGIGGHLPTQVAQDGRPPATGG